VSETILLSGDLAGTVVDLAGLNELVEVDRSVAEVSSLGISDSASWDSTDDDADDDASFSVRPSTPVSDGTFGTIMMTSDDPPGPSSTPPRSCAAAPRDVPPRRVDFTVYLPFF